jgi:hypothetical protein
MAYVVCALGKRTREFTKKKRPSRFACLKSEIASAL